MSDVGKVDANLLRQQWRTDGISEEEQKARIGAMLTLAKPLIMLVAEQVREMPEADQRLGVYRLVDLLRTLDDNDREFYLRRVSRESGISVPDLRGQLKGATKKKKNGDEEDEGEPIYTVGGWIGEWLLELFYDEKEYKTFFAVRKPSGEISVMHKCTIDDRVYRPLPVNSIITKKIVRFPNRLPEHQLTDSALLKMAQEHQHKYFDFGNNDFFEDLSPMWVMHSYLYDGFPELSYLRALGDYGTGKTRFLKTIGYMCYRPIYMSGGSSAASLYHLINDYRGTVVLNEADFDKSDEASVIAKILNGGTERDESITKMMKSGDGSMDVEAYNVYSPKVIATRKTFNDRAIASRCLTMEMVPMAPSPEIPQALPATFEEAAREIRNQLTLFRLLNARPNFEIDQTLTDRSIEPRLNQISLALLTSIKDPAMRTQIQRFLREYNEQERSDRYDTMTARVLGGIMRAWAWGPVSAHENDTLRIYMKDIAHATNQITDEMNRQLGDKRDEDDDEDDTSGKDGKKHSKSARMTSRKASETMKKYLQLRTFRATDGTVEYKGTKYVDMAKDESRIRALCERWGVDWKEPNSMTRPVLVYMPRDGSGNLSEEEKSGESFAEERRAWEELKKENSVVSRQAHEEQTAEWQKKVEARQMEAEEFIPEEPPDWQNHYP